MSTPGWPPDPSHLEPVTSLYWPLQATEYQSWGRVSSNGAPEFTGQGEYLIGPATGGTKSDVSASPRPGKTTMPNRSTTEHQKRALFLLFSMFPPSWMPNAQAQPPLLAVGCSALLGKK